MSARGSSLLFLFSLPRSGSTLLQRILGSHSQIHATSEPWLMLPLVMPLHRNGINAQWDASTGHKALKAFLTSLPRGDAAFLDAIAGAAERLYDESRAASGKRLFLDKTPRYYLIYPELQRMFPEARFIVLLRHPLAALSSIRRAWAASNLFNLRSQDIDIVWGPERLLGAIQDLGDRCGVVRYEALVADPAAEVAKLCQRLGLEFEPSSIDYRGTDIERFPIGDQNVYNHDRPHRDSVEQWRQELDEPQAWRLANDYLEMLGAELLERLGYSWSEARAALDAKRPGWLSRHYALPLSSLLALPIDNGRRFEYALQRLGTTLVRQGLRGAFTLTVERLLARIGVSTGREEP